MEGSPNFSHKVNQAWSMKRGINNHKKLYKDKAFLLVDWGPMMEGLEH